MVFCGEAVAEGRIHYIKEERNISRWRRDDSNNVKSYQLFLSKCSRRFNVPSGRVARLSQLLNICSIVFYTIIIRQKIDSRQIPRKKSKYYLSHLVVKLICRCPDAPTLCSVLLSAKIAPHPLTCIKHKLSCKDSNSSGPNYRLAPHRSPMLCVFFPFLGCRSSLPPKRSIQPDFPPRFLLQINTFGRTTVFDLCTELDKNNCNVGNIHLSVEITTSHIHQDLCIFPSNIQENV